MTSQKPMWQSSICTAIEASLEPEQPFTEITKFPAVTRDVALLLKAEISHRQVVEAIQAAGVKRLTDIKLFDIFSGEKAGCWSQVYGLHTDLPKSRRQPNR